MAIELDIFEIDPNLQSIQVCDFLSAASVSNIACEYFDEDGKFGSHWLHFRSEVGDGAHNHIDVIRNRNGEPSSNVGKVSDAISLFNSISTSAWVTGAWKFEKSMFPTSGLILPMMGVSTKLNDESLTLTAGRMSISGGSEFDEISWSLDRRGQLSISIDCQVEFVYSDSMINESFYPTLKKGVVKYGFGGIDPWEIA